MTAEVNAPWKAGDRVRHVNADAWSTEPTGTVVEVVGPYSDGAYELLVQRDKPLLPSLTGPSWWPSYYTDRGGVTVL